MAVLLSNASATGDPVTISRSGEFVVAVDGTFDGATVALELLSPDGSSWIAITDGDLTAEGSFVVFLGAGSKVRAAVSGGTPSALYASIN